MKIVIEIIPHTEQRYETAGDWWYDEAGDLQIRVSDLHSWRMEALIGIHEAIEAVLCKSAGISGEDVDRFDKQYEAARQDGDDSEPGDAPDAPYYHEHQIATGVERILATELGVAWTGYEDVVNALG
jgi:hypothetical protein